MKPRKVVLTIELFTNISLRDFNKIELSNIFEWFRSNDEVLEVHQVKAQVVKADK